MFRDCVLLGGEETEVRERDEIRHERRKERQHDRNISRAAPDKRYMAFGLLFFTVFTLIIHGLLIQPTQFCHQFSLPVFT